MSQSNSTGPTGPAATAEADATGLWAKVKAYFSKSVIATAIGAGVVGLIVGHLL